MVGADIFTVEHNALLCIVDHYSKFPVIKKTDDLLADILIKVVKIVFAEFSLLKEIVSDAGTNIISHQFKQFCRQLNVEQTISPPYHNQRNGWVEACINS